MKKWIPAILFSFIIITAQGQVSVRGLLCENRQNPLGVDAPAPRFNWELQSDRRNVSQTGYEIRVSLSAADLNKGRNLEWNSGKVLSAASVHVRYAGNPLEAGRNYYWQVRIWDELGKASAWSGPAFWQSGLMDQSNWRAKWIAEAGTDTLSGPSPLFRREFNSSKKVLSATLFITCHGLYEAFINGKKAGDGLLTPGFTSYNKRLQYQAYDVSGLLRPGKNVIGAMLGSGWYRSPLAWAGHKNIYGNSLALLAQLEIRYADGSTETVATDDQWKTAYGAILSSEIYNGETYDDREVQTGWKVPGFNDLGWSSVRLKPYPFSNIIYTENELITKHEIFKPIKVFKTPAGDQVIDFGQNLVGWVQVTAHGKKGDEIRIYHAEVLDKAGNFYTANLRDAKQLDTYILNGEGEEHFEPHFTFQGFRYIKIEGYPGEIKPENFIATALYSNMPVTGTFTTSNALINQLQHNIQWGQKGNFLDVPTDCPQRDERLGWTGDAQAFSRTATFNMGVNEFFSKWLKDVSADQNPDGGVPFVVPNVLGPGDASSAGWADVATIIPWNMYLAYADTSILKQQYASMKGWVNYMRNHSEHNLWDTGFGFGDWLSYQSPTDNSRSANTDKHLIAQCFYAHSTQLLINTANLLGFRDDAAFYSELLEKIKRAFLDEYVTYGARMISNTQTAYVLALQFDMLPESLRRPAVDRLVENIKSYDDHLTTGFLGTPYLCGVLTRFGHADVAYRLLLQETYPSWLYPVKMGATTIWERWDGEKPDSTFEDPGMNSFNHYAYGAIGDFMYRDVAGLDTDPAFPGYKKIRIMPHPGGNLSFVQADLKTYYGLVSSHWKMNGSQFQLDVQIPPNTSASIYLPTTDASSVMENGKPTTGMQEVSLKENEGRYQQVERGSGKYQFTCNLK
ncbi:MAG: family 78 glycoside hydrolase catalytic domain [Puia sp.]